MLVKLALLNIPAQRRYKVRAASQLIMPSYVSEDHAEAIVTCFITSLLNDKYSEKLRKTSLDDYLSSLWHITLPYKPTPRLTYDLIADLLVKAVEYPPVHYDWTPSLQQKYMYQWETLAAANTPEYFAEIKTYAFFERRIKRQIIDLKRMSRGLPLPAFVRWENQTVEGFLERGTYSEDNEKDEILTWGDFSAILGQGNNLQVACNT